MSLVRTQPTACDHKRNSIFPIKTTKQFSSLSHLSAPQILLSWLHSQSSACKFSYHSVHYTSTVNLVSESTRKQPAFRAKQITKKPNSKYCMGKDLARVKFCTWPKDQRGKLKSPRLITKSVWDPKILNPIIRSLMLESPKWVITKFTAITNSMWQLDTS